jgi:dimethylargininase
LESAHGHVLVYTSPMLIAITRAVSPRLAACELSFIAREAIDIARAAKQHQAYEQILARLGAKVISLPAEPELPDSMFVEDPALVLDELAVVFTLGAESRRAEAASIKQALAPYRNVERVEPPGTMEGGDILRLGRTLFVGTTRRTNREGIRQLTAMVRRFGYEVVPVEVAGCLHLKSAVTLLGGNTILANRAWFEVAAFRGCEVVEVAPGEPHAANALALNGKVIFPESFPLTRRRIERAGFEVVPLDISELQKAEAGLTCSSLLFTAPDPR